MQWYYANDGQRHGPVSAEEFKALVDAGTIHAATLVWRNGMANWQPYAEVAAASVPNPPIPAEPGLRSDAGSLRTPTSVGGASQVQILGYGGFWRRVLAKIIDGFITGMLSWIILIPLMIMMLGGMENLTSGSEPTPEQLQSLIGFQLVGFVVQIVIPIIYGLFFISKYDATPGKLALGMRIYRADSSRLTKGRIIGRYFAELLSSLTLGIGYLIAAFDSEKRTLHDHIADTRVVRVP